MPAANAVNNQPGVDPWLGAGRHLPPTASPSEVLEAVDFFDVEERELRVVPGDVPVVDKKALVRADTGACLAVVGRGYQVVQYSSVFKTIVEAGAEIRVSFKAFGTFDDGARAWMLGEFPQPITVRGDDSPLKRFVLAIAGHDGGTAVILKNTALRVWCSNGIGAALGSAGGLWRVHHTRSAPQRLEEVARGFRVVQGSFIRLGEIANQLAATTFTSIQMSALAQKLLPIADDGLDHTRTRQNQEKLLHLFENGAGVTSSMRGTGWAAVNAVTEFFDHHRTVRPGHGEPAAARRLESQWLGTAASKKEAGLLAIADAVGIRLGA